MSRMLVIGVLVALALVGGVGEELGIVGEAEAAGVVSGSDGDCQVGGGGIYCLTPRGLAPRAEVQGLTPT